MKKIRLRNIPVPEVHVVALVVAIVLNGLVPWRLFQNDWIGILVGLPVLVGGVLLAGWAVREADEVELDAPERLVTTGPYAYTRNPMYVAWTLIYIGVSSIINTLWSFAFLPVVLAITHYLVVLREERRLRDQFGGEYEEYCSEVRRY